jgi:dTMP kinase
VLITFEGVEGSGKTTQMLRLGQWLRRRGHRVERTAEPDGTALGARIRRLFDLAPQPLAEVFLFMAARRQHVAEKIDPWLRRGRIVLCDRYTDATVAYQGYGSGLDRDLIRELNVQATGGVLPDLTVLFDIAPAGTPPHPRPDLDHFERGAVLHRRVRRATGSRAEARPSDPAAGHGRDREVSTRGVPRVLTLANQPRRRLLPARWPRTVAHAYAFSGRRAPGERAGVRGGAVREPSPRAGAGGAGPARW